MAIESQTKSLEPEQSQSTQSSLNDLMAVPYTVIGGSYTLPDSYLSDVFDRMLLDGILQDVFYDVVIHDAQSFIDLLRAPSNIPVFILKGRTCIGFAWLNGVITNAAYGHFCYFKNDEVTAIEFGNKVIDYWSKLFTMQDMRVLLGSVPDFNKRAIAFVKKLGFTEVGEIPFLFESYFHDEKQSAHIFYKVISDGLIQ